MTQIRDMAVVPVTPTEAMLKAGEAAAWDDDNSMPAIRAMPKAWAAMLAVAPQALANRDAPCSGSSAKADTQRAAQGAVVAHMVQRFLGWRLPEDFSPDNGISFKPTFNDHMDPPMRCSPVGTNLLDALQAEAMVRHMLEGLDK